MALSNSNSGKSIFSSGSMIKKNLIINQFFVRFFIGDSSITAHIAIEISQNSVSSPLKTLAISSALDTGEL